MTTTPEAVDALENAILSATDGYTRDKAKYVAQHLLESGFTIAPVGAAKQPEELYSPALTRAQQMTEAELKLAMEAAIYECEPERNKVKFAIEIAKKYRG